MTYLPIQLDVRGRRTVVIGGGEVARRKVEALLECGACVTVISPRFCPALAQVAGIERVERPYRTGDLAGACLVIGATDAAQVNRAVAEEAGRAGIPCNIVDQPELCSFIAPAVLRRGALTVTVSTDGVSPSLAKRLRRQLADTLSPALDVHLRLLAEMRPLVKRSGVTPAARSRLLQAMADEAIDRLIEADGEAAARRRLHEMLAAAARQAADTGTGAAPATAAGPGDAET